MEEDRQRQIMDIQRMLIRVDRYHRAAVENRLESMGIHRSQHRILMFIFAASEREPPAQDEIAKAFDISAAAVAVSVKKLEKAGLVQRSNRAGNARVKCVRLTDEGREILDVTRGVFESIDKAMFAGISGEELDTMESALGRIYTNLKELAPESEPADNPSGCGSRKGRKTDEKMV